MSAVENAEEIGERLEFSQRGDLKSFFRLSVRNGLLNLVTLTLYRFWGKTEVRRRLWSTTYLNGEPFEYTGRGVELFVGFLLTLAALGLPFLFLLFGAQFLGPAKAAVAILPLYLLLLFLRGFGRFTAFRYIATRSSWRGVRFHLRGSPLKFGLAWLGYVLLSAITFDWFWPAADRRLSGRLWDGLSFGDRNFKFRIDIARKEHVYGPFFLSIVLIIAGNIVLAGIIRGVLLPLIGVAHATGAPQAPTLGTMTATYLIAGGTALYYAFALSPFHAAMLRSVVSGIGFDDVRFRLRLNWLEFGGLTVTNLVLLAASLGLLMPFVEARSRKFLLSRLEARGAFDFATVAQNQAPRPRTGEGLADAFGFVTI